MAEIISWLKVIGYVLVPIVLFLAVSRSVKNYKIKNGRLEIDQHSEKITNLKPNPLPAKPKKSPDIVDDNLWAN